MDIPIDRSWWVDPGRLLGGPFPGSTTADGLERKLEALLDAGMRSFVSLMEPDETNHADEPFAPYEARLHRLASERGVEVEFHRFPIVDYGIVTSRTYHRILATIESSIEAERPVYLHCWGGHGRTGTVVGCWLRARGRTGENALAEIGSLRSHSEYLRSMESPQTEAQREVVRSWSTGAAGSGRS